MNLIRQTDVRLLGNDLVINENSCNLGCAYCLTGQSNMKNSHTDQLIFQPPHIERYEQSNPFGERLHTIVDRVADTFEAPLLKLTGGEIFIVKGILDFIEKIAPNHAILVLQTNALPLTPAHLERLAKIDNVVLQITLDSSVYDGNSYRVGAPSLHEKLLNRVSATVASGIPFEIYTVLNDKSVEHLEAFVAWCDDFPGNKPQLMPFPVRGPDSERYQVRPDQYHHIIKLRELGEKHPDVMPPPAYTERLISFYCDGGRNWRCHLPRMVLSTFSDGITTACPNIWFNDMGNVANEDWRGVLDQVRNTGFYNLLLSPRPRLEACHNCLTPWDTLSLYFEDEITLDELCLAPSYNHPVIRDLLIAEKQRYRSGDGPV